MIEMIEPFGNENIDNQYENLVRDVLAFGTEKADRTGVGTFSFFGGELRYNLENGFPLITTKKLNYKSILLELLWFISGNTNAKWLQERGCHIWDEWAQKEDVIERHKIHGYSRVVLASKLLNISEHDIIKKLNKLDAQKEGSANAWLDENNVPDYEDILVKEAGALGPIYGKQWRAWQAKDGRKIDQLQNVINLLNTDPDSRRIIISAWNVGELEEMALMPCHSFMQFYSTPDKFGHNRKLSIKVTQRSADLFLGVPFNIASYATLLIMVAQQTGHTPFELLWSGGDCHVYKNHIEQVSTQLDRRPFKFPKIVVNKKDNIDSYTVDDFVIEDYQCHGVLKAPVAV